MAAKRVKEYSDWFRLVTATLYRGFVYLYVYFEKGRIEALDSNPSNKSRTRYIHDNH